MQCFDNNIAICGAVFAVFLARCRWLPLVAVGCSAHPPLLPALFTRPARKAGGAGETPPYKLSPAAHSAPRARFNL